MGNFGAKPKPPFCKSRILVTDRSIAASSISPGDGVKLRIRNSVARGPFFFSL
jgi:hypothetical protein